MGMGVGWDTRELGVSMGEFWEEQEGKKRVQETKQAHTFHCGEVPEPRRHTHEEGVIFRELVGRDDGVGGLGGGVHLGEDFRGEDFVDSVLVVSTTIIIKKTGIGGGEGERRKGKQSKTH